MKSATCVPFSMPEMLFEDFPKNIFCAVDFVTKGEEHKSIQKAVDACALAGGGTVVVGAGEWISGPVHLYSNIQLHLEKGAEVHFQKEFAAYLPVVFTRWEGVECYNYSPLIFAENCRNVAITGEGRLIGGGEAWWHWKKLQQEAANELCYAERNHIPVENRIYGTEEAALRPSFIQFINCIKVRMEDFTIEEGPQWTLHPVYCEQVLIRNVSVHTTGPNTDGLNPDSCRNVRIEGCRFSTGDDCIAVNSGMNEDGWRVGKPCENIVILNCEMNGGHGAIVIGSGMSGGVQNVYAANCIIQGTNQGIRVKSMRGRGGYVNNVWFENIVIHDILEEAIQVSMFYPYSTVVPASETPPVFSGIHFKKIYGSGGKIAVTMQGLQESRIKNITMEDIGLGAEQAIVCDNVEQICMKTVTLQEEAR